MKNSRQDYGGYITFATIAASIEFGILKATIPTTYSRSGVKNRAIKSMLPDFNIQHMISFGPASCSPKRWRADHPDGMRGPAGHLSASLGRSANWDVGAGQVSFEFTFLSCYKKKVWW